MVDVPTISAIVAAAAGGDQAAWEQLVLRFMPLVYAIIRRHRVNPADAQDVSQTVWLRLVEHLDDVRDPNALPGWIAVTTRNETLRVLKARNRTVDVDPMTNPLFDRRSDSAAVDEELLRAEQRQMIRDGLEELPPKQREFLLLLAQDPPLSYQDISRRLKIPVGSIGPTRARCLERLRATNAMRANRPANLLTENMGGDSDGADRR